MTLDELMTALHSQGFILIVENGDSLKVSPASKLTPELRTGIKTHKAAIIAVLKLGELLETHSDVCVEWYGTLAIEDHSVIRPLKRTVFPHNLHDVAEALAIADAWQAVAHGEVVLEHREKVLN